MASHGVPRAAVKQERSVAAREKELQEIKQYKSLVDSVGQKAREKDYSPDLLQETAALLNKNPEYYTIWNIRRRIYANEFESLHQSVRNGELANDSKDNQILQIIQLDLQFLFPLLLKFPKCYWIWNHRLWLLEQSLLLLPVATARKIWEDELGLVGKMLARDSRNFHGWGYRRAVVQSLESAELGGSSMARQEFDYTTKMIGSNLSNFSAWHNRTKLIIRILDENHASRAERQSMLDQELKLIHNALFDPYDQSLWFYHQNLMSAFDPDRHLRSIVPDLSIEEKTKYLLEEQEFLKEVLEEAEDCKWAYQALIECATMEGKLKGGLTSDTKTNIIAWLNKLKELDLLRNGRWTDMELDLKGTA